MGQKQEYINVPMELFEGFLESQERRDQCLSNVIGYEIGKCYEHRQGRMDFEAICNRIGIDCTGIDDLGKFVDGCLNYYRGHCGNKVHFSISTSQLHRFYQRSRTEEECALLMAYLALKSIAGIKAYCKTNKYLWLARMDCKQKAIQSLDELSEQVRRYSTTYQQRRLRHLLEEYYNALFWSRSLKGGKGGLKGFYFTLVLSPKEFMSALLENNSGHKRCPRAIEFESIMQNAIRVI